MLFKWYLFKGALGRSLRCVGLSFPLECASTKKSFIRKNCLVLSSGVFFGMVAFKSEHYALFIAKC